MHSNYNGNLLRNSYGFQLNDPPVLRSQASKGFPMPHPHHPHPNSDNVSSTLRQMETKIEGYEGLVKKKNIQDEKPSNTNLGRSEHPENRPSKQQSQQ